VPGISSPLDNTKAGVDARKMKEIQRAMIVSRDRHHGFRNHRSKSVAMKRNGLSGRAGMRTWSRVAGCTFSSPTSRPFYAVAILPSNTLQAGHADSSPWPHRTVLTSSNTYRHSEQTPRASTGFRAHRAQGSGAGASRTLGPWRQSQRASIGGSDRKPASRPLTEQRRAVATPSRSQAKGQEATKFVCCLSSNLLDNTYNVLVIRRSAAGCLRPLPTQPA
jgi:hypothetical protein